MRQVDPIVQNNKVNYTNTDGGERSLLLGELLPLLQQGLSAPVTSGAFLITFRGLTTRASLLEAGTVSAPGFAELSVEEMLRETRNKGRIQLLLLLFGGPLAQLRPQVPLLGTLLLLVWPGMFREQVGKGVVAHCLYLFIQPTFLSASDGPVTSLSRAGRHDGRKSQTPPPECYGALSWV